MSFVPIPPLQLDRGDIRHNLDGLSVAWRTIIDKWREDGAKHTEKSHAQQFWSDLLRCFGIIPERIRLFERDATRASSGRTGYIDLFWSGVVIGEAKSLGKNLDEAGTQALDYLAGGSIGQHEWPRYAIVSDFENMRVAKLGEDGWTVGFAIDEISDHVDQLMFLAGQETVTKRDEEEASFYASALMANLYTAMLGDEADEGVGEDAPTDPEEEDWRVQKTSVFLTRVLFLLYGDDAGLWEEDLFYRFVLYDTTGDSLGAQLAQLFQVLNTPESRRRNVPESMARFPYVNGSLFAETWPSEFFTAKMREALLAACRFHWTRISPAVFGSMFQLVKSREARRADGEHYTSETNILKVIEPLFLSELRSEAARLIRNSSTTAKALREFRDSLAEMIFLDPACGCGNFLVVAYRELRAIETDIIVALRKKEGQLTGSLDVTLDQKMSIGQFYGFEINWWPAKIAETAMFLVDHQANRALAAAVGDAPNRLPIKITAHICHENALLIDWQDFLPNASGPTFVFGNPPFIGQDTRSKDQLAEMKEVWHRKNISRLDYVTCWHVKAATLLSLRKGNFAFVTTSSVFQGEQVPLLFGYLKERGWAIMFAHRTFVWDSEVPGKAAVHCVVVGFTRARQRAPRLWEYDPRTWEPKELDVDGTINGYLVNGPEIVVTKASTPISSAINFAALGAMPKDGGGLVVESEDYEEVVKDPIAAKYVRPYCGSRELVRGLDRWCLWLVDLDPADISKSPVLQQRLNIVRNYRENSDAESTQKLAKTPQLFAQRFVPSNDFLCIPSVVSERRPYFTVQDLPAGTIVSSLAFAVDDPDGFQFAIASSSMFIVWQRAIGGRLESRLRFASTLTWHTFPLPDIDGDTREAIVAAGQGIVKARNLHPKRSLADSYNPLGMDPHLVRAHENLDRAVDRAFGARKRLSGDRQRLELLFEKYAEITKKS